MSSSSLVKAWVTVASNDECDERSVRLPISPRQNRANAALGALPLLSCATKRSTIATDLARAPSQQAAMACETAASEWRGTSEALALAGSASSSDVIVSSVRPGRSCATSSAKKARSERSATPCSKDDWSNSSTLGSSTSLRGPAICLDRWATTVLPRTSAKCATCRSASVTSAASSDTTAATSSSVRVVAW